ncbi:aminodeoxychorismate synthase component I [Vaginella massiliensis]|uniref:aminodeoxychorismate synthase component I n=1 Tax=Vaginella massiliensis TaxID=1816680 RepID=UPI0008386358|nr:aminodeoxychorismate synthase component I [Vaginella massiliensis]
MEYKRIIEQMNAWGAQKEPFFFMINFEKTEGEIFKLNQFPKSICYEIEGKAQPKNQPIEFQKSPIAFELYLQKFQSLHQAILRGDSYLLNFTQPTKIETTHSLVEIYHTAKAKFKLLTPNFVCFSPERFVKISDNQIFSYPMKGTIDATIPNAKEKLLNDEKEAAEHATIVDLIRNDLSLVAENVEVKRYRYIDQLKTNQHDLLQVSSEIVGKLPANYTSKLGDIFDALLPAGSISGAPKKKTVELILENEGYDRGYYTGVFGVFDGENLDSGVLIRFIEEIDGQCFYKSGGGITHKSDAHSEYNEMIQKIYVPLY